MLGYNIFATRCLTYVDKSSTYPFPKLVNLDPQEGGVVNLAPRAGGVEECWGTRLGKGFPLACLRSLSLSGGEKMSWGG